MYDVHYHALCLDGDGGPTPPLKGEGDGPLDAGKSTSTVLSSSAICSASNGGLCRTPCCRCQASPGKPLA